MKQHKRAAVELAALVVVAIVVIGVVAQTTSAGPALNCPGNVPAGGTLQGQASYGGQIVTVRIFLDGQEVGMDGVMEGDVNAFDFPIPEEWAGRSITVRATSIDGTFTEQVVQVD